MLNIKIIKKIERAFSKFDKTKNYEDFLNTLTTKQTHILNNFPYMSNVIITQLKLQKGLQPSILVETYIFKTIMDKNNINIKTNHKIDNLTNIEKRNIRLAQTNNNGDYIYLLGSPHTADIITFIDGKITRMDVKESKARLYDKDLTKRYGENGYLNKFDNFIYPLVKNINVLENPQNIKIGKYITKERFKDILQTKNIDVYIFWNLDRIHFIKSGDLFDNVDITNSEIRIKGRNVTRIFTPLHFRKVLNEIPHQENETSLKIHKKYLKFSKSRMNSNRFRVCIGELYIVKYDNYVIFDDYIYINKEFIKQYTPSISVHLFIKGGV